MAVLATLVEAPAGDVGAKLLVEESGARVGGLGYPELDEAVALYAQTFLSSRAEAATFRVDEFARDLKQWSGSRVMFERIEPEPHLVICGAGHVGASLAQMARFLGYRTTLIDDRADFVTRERFPDEGIELIAAESWTDAVRASVRLGRGVSVAVVTRGHNEDEECLRAVRPRDPLTWPDREPAPHKHRARKTAGSGRGRKQLERSERHRVGHSPPSLLRKWRSHPCRDRCERHGGTAASLSAWRTKQER